MTPTTDYSLIYAIAGLFTMFMFIFGILLVWVKLGGWPEGTYRMLRIPYFSAIFVDSGGTPRRFPLKLSELKTDDPQLPAYFRYKFDKDDSRFRSPVGRYYTVPQWATRHNGRDSWYFYPDNPYPIPLRNWTSPFYISAKQLEDSFNSETMREFLGIGQPKKEKKASHKLLYLGLGAFVFILIIVLIVSLGVIK